MVSQSVPIAYCNCVLHTGYETLHHYMVLVAGGSVVGIEHEETFSGDAERRDLRGAHLAPAFIDLQVYGGNGLLFSDQPSVASIAATYKACLEGGTAYFQPTLATHSPEVMQLAIGAVKDYRELGLPGVIGLHLEGPYIHAAKLGAHVAGYIQTPTVNGLKSLMTDAQGILSMMTIAPELFDRGMIHDLLRKGVVLSAGHSNATYAEGMEGFDSGIIAATHLYNAMSPLRHRAPGMVGALFNRSDVWTSVVADGHHVDFAAIRIAKQLLGDKLFLITDAVTGNSTGQYRHQLSGDKYVLPDGTLSGSALTMMKAVRNCVERAGISLDEALRMATLYPARLMKLDDRLGTIQLGMEASFVVFDGNYIVRETITPLAGAL